MAEENVTDYGRWVGRQREAQDIVSFTPVRALAAMLDMPPLPNIPSLPLPPGWHWLFFLTTPPQHSLGADGAEGRGDFLPPIDLPRRMWAGGRFEFHHPLRIGALTDRVSTIKSVEEKVGRQGPLAFVTLRHELSHAKGELALAEEQIIAFRAPAQPGERPAPQAAPARADWQREVVADPTFLFRFSALTFNAHRIHYDRPYATEIEGYPGLVVHGPLQALLLLELLRAEAPQRPIRRFEYRAHAPLFDTGPFTVNGAMEDDEIRLWTADRDGNLGMMGVAGF